MRNAIKVILLILLVYLGYLVADTIHLMSLKKGDTPWICISTKIENNQITYYGLGNSVTYYLNGYDQNEIQKCFEDGNLKNYIQQNCYGKVVLIFNITGYAWVE